MISLPPFSYLQSIFQTSAKIVFLMHRPSDIISWLKKLNWRLIHCLPNNMQILVLGIQGTPQHDSYSLFHPCIKLFPSHNLCFHQNGLATQSLSNSSFLSPSSSVCFLPLFSLQFSMSGRHIFLISLCVQLFSLLNTPPPQSLP